MSEIIRVISKSNKRAARVRFEITSMISFSYDVIGWFQKALKSDWLFCFAVPFSLAEKKVRFRAKDSAICE